MNKPINVMATKNQTDITRPIGECTHSLLVYDLNCGDTNTKKPSI
ncbi:hypothetical protein THF1C08_270014 [Vibrio jasicida]|uniref:Uncharacterized protein n=1 Tax=Vibrio jasicida TaxID=766224 RepID=A0AAU9QM62_9VIBR|nr:hypothetical protein THF1C08_270014 [Vibrio jasicida]CAH1592937.1 hypothetical protein THF1A12_260014 [Vibrio jasicida]